MADLHHFGRQSREMGSWVDVFRSQSLIVILLLRIIHLVYTWTCSRCHAENLQRIRGDETLLPLLSQSPSLDEVKRLDFPSLLTPEERSSQHHAAFRRCACRDDSPSTAPFADTLDDQAQAVSRYHERCSYGISFPPSASVLNDKSAPAGGPKTIVKEEAPVGTSLH